MFVSVFCVSVQVCVCVCVRGRAHVWVLHLITLYQQFTDKMENWQQPASFNLIHTLNLLKTAGVLMSNISILQV